MRRSTGRRAEPTRTGTRRPARAPGRGGAGRAAGAADERAREPPAHAGPDPLRDDQFRSLFEHSSDAVILATPEGTILAANPEACRVFGRAEADMLSLGRSGLVDPSDSRLARLVEERARTGLFKGELRFRRSDGSTFPAEVSSAFYRDQSGAMRASIIIRDVTERRRADDALRQANEYLRAIIDGVEEGIIVYDRELRYVVFNRFMERMHGRPASEVLGRRATEVFPWIRESGIDAMVERALRGEAVQARELLLRRAGKSDVWQFARYAPLRDARGEIVGAIALVSDITERRRADDALHATNRFLQEIIDGAEEGIIVYDREMRFVAFNRFMERLHGCAAADVLGKVAPEVFPFLGESGVEQMIRRALAGEVVQARELLLRRPGRSDVWEYYRVGPHRDAAGNIIGAIALVSDVTERHQSEERIRLANAEIAALNRQLEAENVYLRRDLIANVSHDLRTPLAALHGYLETLLVKGEDLAPEKRRGYLETAARQSEHLGTLIAELFELVKLDFKGFEIHPEPVQLGELAQDVLQKFQLAAEERSVVLRSRIDPHLPLASADISLVERVLDNLIDNALRHTPAGGEVRLEVTAGEGGVRLRVADTGSGIPAAELGHIFDRFYRVDRSRSARTGGAGLGLAIVKRIVELHGATIHVDSAPGRGTAFSFSLPVAAR
jgi:hypothetical protein